MVMVSIVIPVFQVKPYLSRCLNSVLAQSYENYEVILVDDGSTDGSSEICDDYALRHSNITVIHKMNGGLSSARNAGLEAAQGELIMFIDSDDLIHEKMLETEFNLLNDTGADAIVSLMKRFSDDNEIDTSSEINLNGFESISGLEAENKLLDNKTQMYFTSSCGKIFRRELFDDLRFPEGRLFEDEYVIYKIYCKCKKLVVTNNYLYYYYINNSGITQTLTLDKRFDEYDAQVERISYFADNGLRELKKRALMKYLHSAQWDLIKCQLNKEQYNRIRGKKLQNDYLNAVKTASEERIINFKNNYDYYVLAYPKLRLFFRIKRLVIKMLHL